METEKPKRTRQMTPELIAKLAEARKKALEIKQKLKEGGDKAKLEHYQEKLKKLSIKKEKPQEGTKVADNCLPLKPQEEEPIKLKDEPIKLKEEEPIKLKEEEPIKPKEEEPIKLKKDKKKVVPLRRKIIIETSNEEDTDTDDEPIIYIKKIKKKIRKPSPPPSPPQEQHFYKEPQIIRQQPIRPPLRVFTSSMIRR